MDDLTAEQQPLPSTSHVDLGLALGMVALSSDTNTPTRYFQTSSRHFCIEMRSWDKLFHGEMSGTGARPSDFVID